VEEGLEELAMVGGEEVDELVDDNVFGEVGGEGEELAVEGEAAGGGDGGPLGAHWADVDVADLDADAGGPVADGPAEVVGIAAGGSGSFALTLNLSRCAG